MRSLREYIHALIKEGQKVRYDGAGIVVLKKSNKTSDGYLMLVLVDEQDEYDIPKGHREPGETPLVTATRETKEEAGITRINFRWGDENIFIGERLHLFIGETQQEPRITPNPETGMYEHVGFKWVTFNEFILKGKDFLRPAAGWARSKIVDADS